MEATAASVLTQPIAPAQSLIHTDPAQCGDMKSSASQLVPEVPEMRRAMHEQARRIIAESGVIPPLPLTSLRRHARQVMQAQSIDECYEDFFTVLLGNAVWEPVVSAIPMSRRLLLLPHCMRNRATCPAEMDAFGLLCESCGNCMTGRLQDMAEALGYTVLIAEGTTVVTQLLKTGKIEAVVGVGCLSALERSFPHLNAAAIPGLAIPLTKDGCENTEIDEDWVMDMLRIEGPADLSDPLDFQALRQEVQSWFAPHDLSQALSLHNTHTEKLATEWMAAGGKRWRPALTAAVARTLNPDCDQPGLENLALAVECFHKASLIHDDIEDQDEERYDKPALHAQHGIAQAINAGDLLVGEGYRLIGQCGAPASDLARMLTTAAVGHRDLCIGQGEELKATEDETILSVEAVLDIFKRKTAPAFSVALELGAIYAGGDEALCQMLASYSMALGIAYQVRDDIEDFMEEGGESDLLDMRPSLLLALAMASNNDMAKQLLKKARSESGLIQGAVIRQAVKQTGLESSAWDLVDYFRNRALEALNPMTNQALKRLLFQILYKILGHRPDNRRELHNVHADGSQNQQEA